MNTRAPRILDRIDRPQDLHALDEDQLVQVAQEVRAHIIDTVGEIGGHFGANLGTCELAVALHSLLDSPRDKVLWDVGHQAYPHKVLTGRRDQLPTIRQYEGLAPFCAIHESEHDIMGAGHASTAIGYAVGLKEGMRLSGDVNAGKVVLHTELLTKVWGPEYRDDLQYLRVWVSRVRRKLGSEPGEPGRIKTFQGIGYLLDVEGNAGGGQDDPADESLINGHAEGADSGTTAAAVG